MTIEGKRYLPERVPIVSYGEGGFHFAGMSHRGSLLCLPSGLHAWAATEPYSPDAASLEDVFAEADEIDFLLLGCGKMPAPIGDALRWRLREARIQVDSMTTGAAVSTWNILLDEGRRVAAALIAVP